MVSPQGETDDAVGNGTTGSGATGSGDAPAGVEPAGAYFHPRAKLQDTPETAERFHGYGLNAFPQWRMGLEEGVHGNTICSFLKIAPLCRGRYQEGRAEAKARRAGPAAAEPVAADREREAADEICPTCGGRIGLADETVTFTAAELAEAREDFANLIDRHLAARDAADAAGDSQ